MLKKRLKNPIFVFYILVSYVTIQFCWWLYLLYKLYNQIYNNPDTLSSKLWMLLGEGIVFFCIMVLGIFIILRAFKYEQKVAKDQENFVLSITHELKTPISSVKLALQTLKKRTLSPEKVETLYDQSLLEINRLDSLVNNLLLTRNIENNNYFLSKSTTNLKELVENTVNQIALSVLKKHEIKTNLASVEHEVDQLAFQSILINLLENASKYSAAKTCISIDLFKKNNSIFLSVTDEGIGIPKSQKENVFRKFYRDENEMTRKSKGTGLGLFISKFLVQQHGGKIKIEDNQPKGTTVIIELNV